MTTSQDGFYPHLLEKHPTATFSKWLFSSLAQLFAGLMLIVCSFVLTMTVNSVLNVMLNLTALLFMMEIDDIGFAMAKLGFVSDTLQRETLAVMDIKVPKRERRNIYRRLLYLMVLGGLFTGYGILKKRQLNGFYLPTYVYVQFGGKRHSRSRYDNASVILHRETHVPLVVF